MTLSAKRRLLPTNVHSFVLLILYINVQYYSIITMNYLSEQLDQSGTYQFKVKVSGANQAYGYAFINVTVLPG